MPNKALTIHHIPNEQVIALHDPCALCQHSAKDIGKIIRAEHSQ
ncbi:hypothetical protein [Algoriphagus aquaeductus]|nr:hypothetical protein [Algoriphagus aquaeductus]